MGRVLADDFIRPGGRLGILRRVGNRWVPARGAPNARAELLREGPADELALGALGRLDAQERAAGVTVAQDTVRILVLRVDFLTDRGGTVTTGNGKFDLSPPDTVNMPIDPTPHNRAYVESHMEALRRYYLAATNGRLHVEWDVYPQADTAYHASDMADYGPWRVSPDIFDVAYKMVRSLIAAADTQDVSIPWSKFDRVIVIHAGSDLQSDVKLDSPQDIPTFTIGLNDSLSIPVADSTFRVFGTAILPETVNQDGYFAALNAVNAHENGHNIFGWRDVYNVNSGFPVCGEWTLMDTGNLVGTTVQVGDSASGQQFFAIGLVPPLADPYQRHLAYDDSPKENVPDWGVVDSLTSPLLDPRAIKVPLSSEEYLLLENRQADLNGDDRLVLARDPANGVILGPGSADSLEYDFLLPGTGVLAWHVDESVVAFDPPGRRADEFFTINGNPDRQGLSIYEADGLDDLGDFTSPFALGSPLDPFFVPNNGKLSISTRPPLVTNSGTIPHVTVDVLDTTQLVMHVRVTREWALAGWPVKARATKGGIDPLVMNFGGAIGRRVVFAAGDGAIHSVRADGTGEILFQASASISPVAELDHPTLGPLAVAVYPDPATLNDYPWAMTGSWIVAVDGNGHPAPGFPLQLDATGGGKEWITADPIVSKNSGGSTRIVVGTRTGRTYQLILDATLGIVMEQASNFPLVSLAAYTPPAGSITLAAADSLGSVFVGAPFQKVLGGAGSELLLAWVELDTGAGGAQTPSGNSTPELVIADRASGKGWIYSVGAASPLTVLRGVDAPIAGIAAGDLDGDGFNEVVLTTQDGRVGYWNLSGSATPGWPKQADPEPFAAKASPVVGDVGGAPTPDLVVATGSGRVLALDPDRKVLPGWPLGTGAGQVGSPALLDVDGDGSFELLIGDADSLLYAYNVGPAPASAAPWPVRGHDPGRSSSLIQAPTSGSVPQDHLVVAGSLRCYPNPAKSRPMTIAFRLREPSRVKLTVYDPTGRKVAELEQDGLRSDNALVWNPGDQAPGLYLGRLELASLSGTEEHLLSMAVLH